MQADQGLGQSLSAETPELVDPDGHYNATALANAFAESPSTAVSIADPSICNLTASVYSPHRQEQRVPSVTWNEENCRPNVHDAVALESPRVFRQIPRAAIENTSTTARMKQTARKYFSLSSVKERQKRVSQFLQRAKSIMRDSFRDGDPAIGSLTTQKSFQRCRHVWVDVDLSPHQLQYYALLLLDFKKQLEGTQVRRLDTVDMVAYLRVAANAVELLPDCILTQLVLENRVDIQGLNETFTDMLNCSAPQSNPPLSSRLWRHRTEFDHDADSNHASHCIVCELCAETRADTRLQPCGHTFHHGCLMEALSKPACAGNCPRCQVHIEHMQEASLLEIAVRQIGAGYETKLNSHRPWVLSNKYQKILECLEFELAKAAKEKVLVRFVVVSDYKPMVEGFSRTLAAFGKIHYDVIFGGINKFKIPSQLVKYGASLEPRLLLYHSSAVSNKHDLSSTTHIYFMTPWRDQEVRRNILSCVLRDSIAGPPVLIADFVATDSIEAEALQVITDSTEADSASELIFGESSWYRST